MLRQHPTSLAPRPNLKAVRALNAIMLALFCLLSAAPVLTAPTKQLQQPQLAQHSPSSEIRELKPGQFLEREIANGQSHLYTIKLVAGQFLHLTVEQKDVDAEIQLLNPAGKAVAGINW